MTEKQFEEYIFLIQKNNYIVKQIQYDQQTFKRVIIVESKSILVPPILISFTESLRSNGMAFLDELEELNKQVNHNKPLIIMLVLNRDSELDDNLWFNGNIFAHLIVHNEKLNCIYFENKFHYIGAKKVKKLLNLLKQNMR